jgi:hypothetical protein
MRQPIHGAFESYLQPDSGTWNWNESLQAWEELDNYKLQEALTISGYPRSGNTFINHAFFKMYDFAHINFNRHTVKSIAERDHTFVPFRHPLEAISSWHIYQQVHFLDVRFIENDIKFYNRFHEQALAMKDKITFLDFDLFKNNTKYLEDKVSHIYNVSAMPVEANEVKEFMAHRRLTLNIPRNDDETKQEVMYFVEKQELYKISLDLYNQIKKLSN